MKPVLPTHPQTPLPGAQQPDRPSTRSLLRWGAVVLVLHLVVLLSLAGTLDWQLSSPQTLRTGPMQTRTLTTPADAPTASELKSAPAARTRIALVEKPKPAPTPKPDASPTATPPKTASADKAQQPAASAEPQEMSVPDPVPEQALAPQTHTEPGAEKPLDVATGPQTSGTLVAEAPATASQPSPATRAPPALPSPSLPLTDNAGVPAPELANDPRQPQAPAAFEAKLEPAKPNTAPQQSTISSDAAAKTGPVAPERIANATLALPELARASLPPSALLSYRLSGQEKGINYQASGEMRWQRNDNAYAMSLTVKAFLLGSRHWRSVGQINATGLAPTRFSDSWRSERAAHFDRPNQRIVFSSNAPSAPLQPGAQDQVSLYVQLAAAMAQSGQQMPPGTRLQIQTATVRDALPWLLTLEKLETLQVDGQSLQTVKWVCQPRNRFDAQVEFWVSAAHDWLPARIRITQASGSFIDLQLTGRQVLSALPLTP
jgi:hypothetical protein